MSSENNKSLLESSIINFFDKKKEYRSLSNFWESEIIIIGENREIRTYESGEHCFHGEKYIRLSQLNTTEEPRKTELYTYGLTFTKPSNYKTGAQVKKMGGKKGLMLSTDEIKSWEIISYHVQKEICRWKFDHYNEVKNDLKKSENKILIHPAMRCSEDKVINRIWEGKGIIRDGKVVVLGKNLLGEIWMELRKNL